jgi:hypothetical protein
LKDLLGGLAGDEGAAVGAMGDADGGVQETDVVVDFGDGADGGAGAAVGGFLLDGDGGGEAVDGVDVGALELIEELAGVGGEGLDVAALALGVDGVEGEGGLAGAAQAGDDGESIARDFDADVLEVMNARAMNADAVEHSEFRRAEANPLLSLAARGGGKPERCRGRRKIKNCGANPWAVRPRMDTAHMCGSLFSTGC